MKLIRLAHDKEKWEALAKMFFKSSPSIWSGEFLN
jgi:hypothetical protein